MDQVIQQLESVDLKPSNFEKDFCGFKKHGILCYTIVSLNLCQAISGFESVAAGHFWEQILDLTVVGLNLEHQTVVGLNSAAGHVLGLNLEPSICGNNLTHCVYRLNYISISS